MSAHLKTMSEDDHMLDGLEQKRAVACYITPAHSIVLGLDDHLDEVIMVADHPYMLSLYENAQHFHERFFYMIDVSADAMTCWRVEHDGSRDMLLERSMKDIDYRPAAGYADGEQPLQSHGGSGPRSSMIFHGHAAQDARNTEERQKRMWRDGLDELIAMLPSSLAPMVLRGEQSQRHAFLNATQVEQDDFVLQTNLPQGGTTREQMLSIVSHFEDADIHHNALMAAWKQAASSGQTEHHTAQVARLVAQGLVSTLCVARTAPMWGEYCEETGDLLIHDNVRMSSGEVRDLIARRAIALGAEVHLLDASKMPTSSPFAAILRGAVA